MRDSPGLPALPDIATERAIEPTTGATLPRLLTLLEVANLLRVSPHTVRSWVRQNRLQPVRICRRLLFSRATIERFIAGAE
jgi:excisionase family DNA binding protein